MRYSYLLILGILLLLLSYCRPIIEVRSEHEPGFQLEGYKTFSFVTEDTTHENQLVWRYLTEIGIIKNSLRTHMEEKGLSFTNVKPDLSVNIGIVVDEKVQTRQTDIQSDPPQYIGQRRYFWSIREVEVGRYQHGTVTIHLIDNKSNELVWMGVAEAIIPKNRDRQERQIREGIAEMVARIP